MMGIQISERCATKGVQPTQIELGVIEESQESFGVGARSHQRGAFGTEGRVFSSRLLLRILNVRW